MEIVELALEARVLAVLEVLWQNQVRELVHVVDLKGRAFLVPPHDVVAFRLEHRAERSKEWRDFTRSCCDLVAAAAAAAGAPIMGDQKIGQANIQLGSLLDGCLSFTALTVVASTLSSSIHRQPLENLPTGAAEVRRPRNVNDVHPGTGLSTQLGSIDQRKPVSQPAGHARGSLSRRRVLHDSQPPLVVDLS
ncbi:hypothetical protein Ae201684P_006980 [Aphanomyces euteiches]|nr:hypothetical protein Ae201684P_006980 [Aphanomyces euteiches]